MKPRHQDAMGTRERRTQEASVAALRSRLRTPYRAAQCCLEAAVWFETGSKERRDDGGQVLES